MAVVRTDTGDGGLEAQLGGRRGARIDGVIRETLEGAVRDGVFPGAVYVVTERGNVLSQGGVGARGYRDPFRTPVSLETVYDIGGLTAPIVTTTLIMKLVEEGRLQLTDHVYRFVQGFSIFGKSPIQLHHLLYHTSGLAAWAPFYEDLTRGGEGERSRSIPGRGVREDVYIKIHESKALSIPGERFLMSDLGLIQLGEIIEVLSATSFDRAAYRSVFHPLGLRSTSFIDLGLVRRRGLQPVTERIAPTEQCPWRKRVLCGEVHDDNAWAIGGIAPHSGVFASAGDVARVALALIDCYHGRSRFLSRSIVRGFLSTPSPVGGWRLGWDAPSVENGMVGVGFGSAAVGHHGFTGCSLWFDPETEVSVTLLTNRIHPHRSNKKIREFRANFYKTALSALSGE